jgi:hypothetical protein
LAETNRKFSAYDGAIGSNAARAATTMQSLAIGRIIELMRRSSLAVDVAQHHGNCVNNQTTSVSIENEIVSDTDIKIPVAASQEMGPKSRLVISSRKLGSAYAFSRRSPRRNLLIGGASLIGMV